MTAFQDGFRDGYAAYDPDYRHTDQAEYLRGYDAGLQQLNDEIDSRWEE